MGRDTRTVLKNYAGAFASEADLGPSRSIAQSPRRGANRQQRPSGSLLSVTGSDRTDSAACRDEPAAWTVHQRSTPPCRQSAGRGEPAKVAVMPSALQRVDGIRRVNDASGQHARNQLVQLRSQRGFVQLQVPQLAGGQAIDHRRDVGDHVNTARQCTRSLRPPCRPWLSPRKSFPTTSRCRAVRHLCVRSVRPGCVGTTVRAIARRDCRDNAALQQRGARRSPLPCLQPHRHLHCTAHGRGACC